MFTWPPEPALAWLLSLTSIAALTDARAGVIPNWLTLPALLGAVIARAVVGGAAGLGGALGAALLCAVPPLCLFALRAMGGGDVKLFAAAGALCGARVGLEMQLMTYGVAIAFASVVLARQRRLADALRGAGRVAGAALGRGAPPELGSLTQVRLGPAALCASAWLLARATFEAAR
jgi:prepilin peptidase CpaA